MNIQIDNIDELEKSYLSLLLNRNELFDLTIIKSDYLNNKQYADIFSYSYECYKKHKIVDCVEIVKKHQDFNIMLFTEIRDETFYQHGEAWKYQLEHDEREIINNYKKKFLNQLYLQLNNQKIDYETFIKRIKELDDIQLTNESKSSILGISDIENDETENTYIKFNSQELDQYVKGYALGQLSVWSGSNASGKSSYLNQLMLEAIEQDYKVICYSGELIAQRLLKWLVMQSAGKDNMQYHQIKQYWYVNPEIRLKIREYLDGKLYIYNNSSGNNAKDILKSIKACVKQYGIKVVVLDNLMSMNLARYGDSKYDMQSAFVQDLSSLAKELNVHIHFVCHPRKTTSFLRKNDISGSADLTNIADNVFIMHRVNQDFKLKTRDTLGWKEDNPIYSSSNVLEIAKNRDFGVEDKFVGFWFETQSKRFLDNKNQKKQYKWELNG